MLYANLWKRHSHIGCLKSTRRRPSDHRRGCSNEGLTTQQIMGEDSCSGLMEDAVLLALVLSNGTLGVVDPDELNEPVLVGPKLNISTSIAMLDEVADFLQWQDGVDVADFHMLATLQAKLLNNSAGKLVQSTLGFPVVPKPFKTASLLFATWPNITDVRFCIFVFCFVILLFSSFFRIF